MRARLTNFLSIGLTSTLVAPGVDTGTGVVASNAAASLRLELLGASGSSAAIAIPATTNTKKAVRNADRTRLVGLPGPAATRLCRGLIFVAKIGNALRKVMNPR